MQNSDWIALIRQIPAEMHSSLVLLLHNRTEISIETLFRLEPSFMIVRGRMGGTTDGGLMFLVPYEQLSSVFMYKELRESELEAMFGPAKSVSKLIMPGAPEARQPGQIVNLPPALAMGAAASGTAAVPAFGRPPEATAVARNNLLERLRAARQAGMPPQNGK